MVHCRDGVAVLPVRDLSMQPQLMLFLPWPPGSTDLTTMLPLTHGHLASSGHPGAHELHRGWAVGPCRPWVEQHQLPRGTWPAASRPCWQPPTHSLCGSISVLLGWGGGYVRPRSAGTRAAFLLPAPGFMTFPASSQPPRGERTEPQASAVHCRDGSSLGLAGSWLGAGVAGALSRPLS